MKRSGDPVIGRSGDRNTGSSEITAPVILSGARQKTLPHAADGRGVEVELTCGRERSGRAQAKSRADAREPSTPLLVNTAGSSFASLRISAERLKRRSERLNFDSPSSRAARLGLAQDDRREENRVHKQFLRPRIHRSVADRCFAVWRLLLATLREIFDESAYERFLRRTQAARSVKSYREFLCERERGVAKQPRCC